MTEGRTRIPAARPSAFNDGNGIIPFPEFAKLRPQRNLSLS
jgi:hypothetical protein